MHSVHWYRYRANWLGFNTHLNTALVMFRCLMRLVDCSTQSNCGDSPVAELAELVPWYVWQVLAGGMQIPLGGKLHMVVSHIVQCKAVQCKWTI